VHEIRTIKKGNAKKKIKKPLLISRTKNTKEEDISFDIIIVFLCVLAEESLRNNF